jgi:hypothetical protein
MSDNDIYFVVTLKAFAFETKEQAQAVADKLLDAFCDLPEADGYGASAQITEEKH